MLCAFVHPEVLRRRQLFIPSPEGLLPKHPRDAGSERGVAQTQQGRTQLLFQKSELHVLRPNWCSRAGGGGTSGLSEQEPAPEKHNSKLPRSMVLIFFLGLLKRKWVLRGLDCSGIYIRIYCVHRCTYFFFKLYVCIYCVYVCKYRHIHSVDEAVQKAGKGGHFTTSKPSFTRQTFTKNKLSVVWFSSFPTYTAVISP